MKKKRKKNESFQIRRFVRWKYVPWSILMLKGMIYEENVKEEKKILIAIANKHEISINLMCSYYYLHNLMHFTKWMKNDFVVNLVDSLDSEWQIP